MKLRCELHLEGRLSRVILVPRPEEKLDHLALKLAAFAMFDALRPVVEISSQHPALAGTDLKPDVCVFNDAGEISIWIECGEVSLNKLGKLTRRLPQTRFIVLKTNLHQAKRLREGLRNEVRHEGKIEIWTWPEDQFRIWLSSLGEKTEIFGEADEKTFNLVVNDVPIAIDLLSV